MFASANLLAKKGSQTLLSTTRQPSCRAATAWYTHSAQLAKSAVEVEHGRGQWKTYGDVENYKPGRYQIKTFNKISPIGLNRFPSDVYDICEGPKAANAHAILLRSHKLQEDEIPHTVRAIARYVLFSIVVSFQCAVKMAMEPRSHTFLVVLLCLPTYLSLSLSL